MAGWYELGKASDGQFHFVLKAANSETILSSERYTTMDAAKNGVASVQQNAADPSRYEKKQSSDGKAYFTLKAANHQVIGTSQMYASEAARDAGIASVQANGPGATVKEMT